MAEAQIENQRRRSRVSDIMGRDPYSFSRNRYFEPPEEEQRPSIVTPWIRDFVNSTANPIDRQLDEELRQQGYGQAMRDEFQIAARSLADTIRAQQEAEAKSAEEFADRSLRRLEYLDTTNRYLDNARNREEADVVRGTVDDLASLDPSAPDYRQRLSSLIAATPGLVNDPSARSIISMQDEQRRESRQGMGVERFDPETIANPTVYERFQAENWSTLPAAQQKRNVERADQEDKVVLGLIAVGATDDDIQSIRRDDGWLDRQRAARLESTLKDRKELADRQAKSTLTLNATDRKQLIDLTKEINDLQVKPTEESEEAAASRNTALEASRRNLGALVDALETEGYKIPASFVEAAGQYSPLARREAATSRQQQIEQARSTTSQVTESETPVVTPMTVSQRREQREQQQIERRMRESAGPEVWQNAKTRILDAIDQVARDIGVEPVDILATLSDPGIGSNDSELIWRALQRRGVSSIGRALTQDRPGLDRVTNREVLDSILNGGSDDLLRQRYNVEAVSFRPRTQQMTSAAQTTRGIELQ